MIDLIERTNPQWHDLWPTIVGDRDMDSRLRGNDGKEDGNNGGQGIW
jgi:hypothetical protein